MRSEHEICGLTLSRNFRYRTIQNKTVAQRLCFALWIDNKTVIQHNRFMKMPIATPPDFYTGAPLDPSDLRFRDEIIDDLWGQLRAQHLLISAPRRTGKTSVLDHLAANPRDGFVPIPVFVQDISHPADFMLLMLDLFHERYPKLFRDLFRNGGSAIAKALNKVGEVELGGFKIGLREQDPNWLQNWKVYGDEFFAQVRKGDDRLLMLVDEFPDMILNISSNHPELVRPFLAWFRGHRLKPHPKRDRVRWLLCGSVNLASTLDSLGCLDEINDIHDVPLPVLTKDQVKQFVRDMLDARGVLFDEKVPAKVATLLGRPIPVFLQMATQTLHRIWLRDGRKLSTGDVTHAFDDLIVSSGARDKLQHFHSRIDHYYKEPKRTAAYSFLAKLSVSPDGLSRTTLLADFERVLHEQAHTAGVDARKRLFNQLMRDLENDFYVAEVKKGCFDFASGLIKQWWRKYYA